MPISMNPDEQETFDQFLEDREEEIEQIMTEKGCSKVDAEAIWEIENTEATQEDD